MKLLEAVVLVQFFLYERQDLMIGSNTAFLGPNGTGKTALLDAIQAVMLAADAHRTYFNAQADGKKRARTLRDYCLGVYDQTEDGRCRDVANTYVAMIFRDEKTGSEVTAGVALSATVQSPEVTVQGLFILPGITVTSASFLEQRDGGAQVLPWKRFQAQAADWCRAAGTIDTAVFTTNREEFTRRLLVEHLAAPGDRPNPQAFRNAFQRSLQLKSMDDLSIALRDHLIEARPTNVLEFRLRLDQFRQMRDVVRLTKEKIDQAGAVCGKYDVVRRERIAEANYVCLKAVYDSERLGESLSDANEAVTALSGELGQAQSEHRRAQAAFEAADAAKERAIAVLHQDPDYARQAGSAQHLGDRQKDLAQKQRALRASVQAMTAAVRTAGGLGVLADNRRLFEEALTQLAALDGILAKDDGTVPDTVTVASALRQVELAYQAVRRALAAAEAEWKEADARRKDAALALERSNRGLVELNPDVGRLQRELVEAGIDCSPVCDLVRISTPEWQPMIEAYLGPHVQALLVPRGKEIAAVRVYDGLRGGQAVYGVKLALPSRLRAYRASAGGHPAALLVDGENEDAVTYLRGELGSVMCVDSIPDLVTGQKGFTRTGMIATGSGVERRRLASADNLRIGRTDTQKQRRKAQAELEENMRLAAARKADEQVLQGALQQLTPFGNAQVTQQDLEKALAEIGAGREVVHDLTEQLADSSTEGTRSLQDAVASARLAAVGAKQQESEGLERVTTLKQCLETSQKAVSELAAQQAIATGAERTAQHDPLYDAQEVDRHRARFDERHPVVEVRMEACEGAIQRSRAIAAAADRDAWSLLTAYLTNHHLAAEGLDGSWTPAQCFIQQERQRLEETELAARLEESEVAYTRALEIFRTDVAQALLSGFDRVDEQMRGLNLVLKNAPAFSNNERYQFRSRVVDLHRPLYEFLQRVREIGGDYGLFGDPGEVPLAFRELMEGDATSILLQDGSPLADHRRFFSFDVEISREGKVIGLLSKRFGPGSGGEHRTPLYVIFGAALAAAYGNVQGQNGGGGIMLLDEAFDKMDTQNVRAAAQYLNSLGLQLIMAGPETDQPKLSSFLSVYYDMGRYGGKTIQMDRTVLNEATRELLASDNPMYHPELIEQEMARLAGGGAMDLSQSTLEHLLARGERARLSGSTRTIRTSYKEVESPYWTLRLDDRVLLHERMRAAEQAGAVRLEWSRQGGDERPLDGVVLVNLELLAMHLGRPTVSELIDTARKQLEPWTGTSLPIDALLDAWRGLRTVRGMGPESAKDFADAAKLITHLRAQPPEDRILRQVSTELFNDSKRVEALQRHVDVLTAEELQASARHPEEVFARIGLRKEPQPFLVTGPGQVLLRDDLCRIVRPYVGVAPSAITGYSGSPTWVLTVENLTTFHVAASALGARTDGLIVYTGGMPSPAWCRAYSQIIRAIPEESAIYHWGDIDEGGYRIALLLQQSCLGGTRRLLPWLMDVRTCGGRLLSLSPGAHATMARNAVRLGWSAIAADLEDVSSLAGCEQESVPVRLPGSVDDDAGSSAYFHNSSRT